MNTASNLVNIIDDLKTQGVTPKVTKLKSAVKKNRRSVWQRQSQHGAGRAMGAVNKSSEGATGATTCGGGAGMNLNKVYGIGASKVTNLEMVQKRYEAQVKADRKAAALDRLAA